MTNDELIQKLFEKIDNVHKAISSASEERAVIGNRLANIESEIARLRERCETRCGDYQASIQQIRVVLATHKGAIWTVSCFLSAAVAFTVAWLKSKW